jgi:hypothetical protein
VRIADVELVSAAFPKTSVPTFVRVAKSWGRLAISLLCPEGKRTERIRDFWEELYALRRRVCLRHFSPLSCAGPRWRNSAFDRLPSNRRLSAPNSPQ